MLYTVVMAHRCEAKDYTQVRPNGEYAKGWVNRTIRCASKDTTRAVLDPRNDHYATYAARGEAEAWFCHEHRGMFDGSRGITKWMPAE